MRFERHIIILKFMKLLVLKVYNLLDLNLYFNISLIIEK